MSTMPMISPDGKIGDVPVDKVKDAEAKGFQRGASLWTPDGKNGVVPLSKAKEALSSGKFLANKPGPTKIDGAPIPTNSGMGPLLQNQQPGADPLGRIPNQQFHVPVRGSEATIDTMKGIAGMPGQMLAPPKPGAETGISTGLHAVAPGFMGDVATKATLAAKRFLVDPQVEQAKAGKDTKGVESAGHYAASLIPVLGPMAAGAGEALKNGEPEKAAYQAIMALTGGHEAAPAVEHAVAMTSVKAAASLRDYAEHIGNRGLNVSEDTSTGISPGREVSKQIEPMTKMKNTEAQLQTKASEMTKKLETVAETETAAGVTIDVHDAFLAKMDQLGKQAETVFPAGKKGVSGPVQATIPFIEKWTEGGKLRNLSPSDALELRRALDDIEYDKTGTVPPMAQKGAKILRNLIDQALDKQVTGWKDLNSAASGLIKGAEAAKEKTSQSAMGKFGSQLRILIQPQSIPEVVATVPVTIAAYNLAHVLSSSLGGGMGEHIVFATGMVGAFRMIAKSMPSKATRMAFATRFADLLSKEGVSGSGAYPPKGPSSSGGPGVIVTPAPGGPSGGAGGGLAAGQARVAGLLKQAADEVQGKTEGQHGPGAASVHDPAFEETRALGQHGDFFNDHPNSEDSTQAPDSRS